MDELDNSNLEKVNQIGRLLQVSGSSMNKMQAGMIDYPEMEKELEEVLTGMRKVLEITNQEATKKELKFLQSLDIEDLYKQATEERSHFYVGSKCKLILERIKFLQEKLK